jgi:hypothetical protein
MEIGHVFRGKKWNSKVLLQIFFSARKECFPTGSSAKGQEAIFTR